MTREEFFKIIPEGAGAIIKTKGSYSDVKAIKVVPKEEWLRNTGLNWEPEKYLELQFMGGRDAGSYNGLLWESVENYLDFSDWKITITNNLYCSCGGPSKKSSMLYGDAFYVCSKCGKEKS